MADSRKWMLLLVLIALGVTSAFAQQANCVVTPATNQALRGGGITELVGDATMVCTNPATVPYIVTFTSLMDATVTNAIGTAVTNQGWPTHATLQTSPTQNESVVEQLYVGYLQPSVPGGSTTANANAINFYNVTLPASSTIYVRISNIRVVVPIIATTGATSQVHETIITNNPTLVQITNPFQLVGTVFPALIFNTTNCAGGTAPNLTFQQCIDQPTSPKAITFGVQFTEAIAGAFKHQSLQDTLDISPNVESGRSFPLDAATGGVGPGCGGAFWCTTSVVDTADTATRVMVTFQNIPTGVTLLVTDQNIGAGTNEAYAVLAAGASAKGVGGTLADPVRPEAGTITCSSGKILQANLVEAENPSANTWYAVWEVLTENPNVNETLLFGVQVQYTHGTDIPALSTTPGSASGTFAPTSTVVQAAKDTSSAPIPRFLDLNLPGSAPFIIAPCVTNLLFPYVTNQAGYDTGIALVNTSLDNSTGSSGTPPNQPFNTPTQHGPCTVYFFGNMDIAPQVTPDFGPGGATQDATGRDVLLQKFTMSFPLDGWADLAGFEGYIIARCNFQFAHGFAFIVDGHVPGFGSEGYLALIIPDTNLGFRLPWPMSSIGAGSGEQLVH